MMNGYTFLKISRGVSAGALWASIATLGAALAAGLLPMVGPGGPIFIVFVTCVILGVTGYGAYLYINNNSDELSGLMDQANKMTMASFLKNQPFQIAITVLSIGMIVVASLVIAGTLAIPGVNVAFAGIILGLAIASFAMQYLILPSLEMQPRPTLQPGQVAETAFAADAAQLQLESEHYAEKVQSAIHSRSGDATPSCAEAIFAHARRVFGYNRH